MILNGGISDSTQTFNLQLDALLAKAKNRYEDTEKLTVDESKFITEYILDCLIEVGNGTSNRDLHQCADLLFLLRDNFLRQLPEYNKEK